MLNCSRDTKEVKGSYNLPAQIFVAPSVVCQHDEVTGLLHIKSFAATCLSFICRPDEATKHVLLLFIDADNLKLVNDALGHGVGDAYILHVAGAMKTALPSNAITCRKGGDEFLAMVPCSSSAQPHQIINNIHAALNQKLLLAGHKILVSCSIGYSLRLVTKSNFDDQVEEADLALYWAKENARGSAKEYCSVDCSRIRQNRQLSFEIQSALDQAALTLEFQPIYFSENRRVVGAEALLRWKHAEFGSISPDQIVQIARESGHGQALSEYVLEQAFIAASSWDDDIYLSVNIQAADLFRADFVQKLLEISQICKFPLNRLHLEVTETEDLKHISIVRTNIEKLRKLGVQVGIDDFGTGYASMHSLNSYSFDFIKVDRSLVSHCNQNFSSRIFLKAIIKVASGLGISVIAEGAETLEEIAFLRSAGYRFVQGYYFSKPLSPERFSLLIELA